MNYYQVGGSGLIPIIFLNGASSAGKTTLGRAVQDLLEAPYLLMGLDTLFSAVPPRWAGGTLGEFRRQGFEYLELPPQDERPVKGIGYGPVGFQMMQGLHRAIGEIVRTGNRVIIDEMLLGPAVRDDWLHVLGEFETLFVAVRCDLHELERREIERHGVIGLARWAAPRVHDGMNYDVVVDTTSRGTEECAHDVVDRVVGSHPLG